MKRRDFIKTVAYSSMLSPGLSWSKQKSKNKYLILIELKGGNDGLNTVVPYNDKLYYSKRPGINIPTDKVIKLDRQIGLHPSLTSLADLYKQGELSIIQNVGYPKPNKSHFTSIDIWERASRNKRSNGWLYELFDKNNTARLIDSIVFSGSTGLFRGPKSNFIKIKTISSFIKEAKLLENETTISNPNNKNQQYLINSNNLIKKVANELLNKTSNTKWGSLANKTPLDRQLSQVSELINTNINIPVLKVAIGGFDTHADQPESHYELLKELNNSVASISNYLKAKNLWNNTLIMTYSEFGRRISENGNNGTDHGEASCMFCTGGMVNGGIYGGKLDLSNTHKDNLIYKIDYRDIYATLERNWFNVENTTLPNSSLKFI
ncbi:MAG: DUF1501 domain-containing protein [PS1 clade bacterium]|jgi:uncharacterized protein (DUF1501 family)|tara:strand:+ start:441 stop:1574 length:1134 start_codon:yes stop_codon:yes gene_type:complete